VRWIGRFITQAEQITRRICQTEISLKWGGVLLWLVVVGSVWLASYWILQFAYGMTFWLGCLIEIWLIYTVLAGRSLSDAADAVYQALRQDN
ncbi:cobalamin biosynthesis protein, partial [Xenorhabdus bovienii]|uniref:cobalamin biosynthesis protein n=1 Tax=Xenorhabdus bovienii TaxID=40576 RepID=UPI0023B245E0